MLIIIHLQPPFLDVLQTSISMLELVLLSPLLFVLTALLELITQATFSFQLLVPLDTQLLLQAVPPPALPTPQLTAQSPTAVLVDQLPPAQLALQLTQKS